MTPKVSIVVPVYKAEDRLAACVDSLLAQTYTDFELLLVDDGSPDSSGALCDALAEKDTRVRVIHQPNGGVSRARNTGMESCRGQWITFVDADDTVEDTFLQHSMEKLSQTGAELSIAGIQMDTWKGEELLHTAYYGGPDREYEVRDLLESKEKDYPTILVSGPCCKLYLAEVIRKYALQFHVNMSLGEDTCFVHDYLQHIERVVMLDECPYHYYRGNGESLYSRYHHDFFWQYARVCEKILCTMEKHQCSEAGLQQERRRAAVMLMQALDNEYIIYRSQSTPKKRKQVLRQVAEHPLIRRCSAREYSNGFSAAIYFAVRHKMLFLADLLMQLKAKKQGAV